MFAARVSVPWGSEARGKKQAASGLTRGIRWEAGEPEDPEPRERRFVSRGSVSAISQERLVGSAGKATRWVQDGYQDKIATKAFDGLAAKVDIAVLYKNPPVVRGRSEAPALPAADRRKLAVLKAKLELAKPPDRKLSVAARKTSETRFDDLPPSLLAWATARGIKRSARPESFQPQDPFTSKSKVVPIEIRKQIALADLSRGEWCLVEEVDVLPSRLRRWLIECKVKFIRWEGGGRIQGTPVNGYVTEDGVLFYVAEDSTTFYVQES